MFLVPLLLVPVLTSPYARVSADFSSKRLGFHDIGCQHIFPGQLYCWDGSKGKLSMWHSTLDLPNILPKYHSTRLWLWCNLTVKTIWNLKLSFSTSFQRSTALRCSNTSTSSTLGSQSTHTGNFTRLFNILNLIKNSGLALALWVRSSSRFLQLLPQRLSCRTSIWIEEELWQNCEYTTKSVMKGRLKLKIWIKFEMVCRVNSQEERYLFTLHVIAVPIWDSQIRALLRLLFSTPSSTCPLFCPHLWSEYFLYFSLGKVCKT